MTDRAVVSTAPAAVQGRRTADAPRVSVIVPARDAAATLPRAVESALADASVAEIVVAVGPSRDDTRTRAYALAAQDPRVRVIDNPSGTTPDALNLAIAASAGEVVVRLDAHAALPPGYVARAVATLRRTGAANVGGRQVPTASRGFARAVAAAMRSTAGSGGATYRAAGTEGPADTVYLGVFVRDVLDQVGGFAPDMVRNQDAELNARLREQGHLVWFDPELEVSYRPRGSVRALARQYFSYGRYRRVTLRRHPSSLRLRQLAPPAIVVALVAAGIVGVVTGQRSAPAVVGGGYLAATAVAGARAAQRPQDAPGTALALVTMHLAWGVGFLLGPPRAAAGRRHPAADPEGRGEDGDA